jgi:hypothetical protein
MSSRDKDEKEEEEQHRRQRQQELLNQVRLLKRLVESQNKGEKIIFDLENPLVGKEMKRLMDIIEKKLGKDNKQQEAEEEKQDGVQS